MPLALDYRPSTLNKVAGNEGIKKSLSALLKRPANDIPRCFAFFGSSGCGKTTIARIVASMLGCESTDFYELNAASVRGIDTIREIEKQIRFKPIHGKKRVWLLDEVHQYPAASQEALLKMFEECPEHVAFMICTTDPQKLKPALKGRCTTFEVKPLTEEEMGDFLYGVCEAEEVDVPEEVIEKIVEISNGAPRNALQQLEKVIDLPKKEMLKSIQQIQETETQVIELCRLLLKKGVKWSEVCKVISTIEAEPEQIRYAVLGYCNSVLLKGDNPRAFLIMGEFAEPTYNTGKPGITMAAYAVVTGG